jgi:hypothetical protein
MASGEVLEADLSQLPAVNQFLAAHDLGTLSAVAIAAFPGRNEIWAGKTTAGRKVFVKQITGDRDSAARRFERSLTFHRLNPPVTTPRCLAWDQASGLLAFPLVAGARSGHDLAQDGAGGGQFPAQVAREMGALVGRLHAARQVDLTQADQSIPDLPQVGWLHGLPADVYAGASAAMLQLWGILQADDDLAAALLRLRDAEHTARRVAAHCDLRLGQFLVTSRRLYLTDWEEFRAADPARDVGTYAGEWLYRAIASVPAAAAGADDIEPAPAHEQIVAACVTGIELRRRIVQAFWHAYRAHAAADADQADAGLAERAAGFAGWHVIDRVMAMAERRARIGATDRAALGIARMVLLKPAPAAALLGLDGS